MGQPAAKRFTRFDINPDDQIIFQGGTFKVTPLGDDHFRLDEVGGRRNAEPIPLTMEQISKQYSLGLLQIKQRYYSNDALKERMINHVVDTADMPPDARRRLRAVVAFLDGERSGNEAFKRSEKKLTEFLHNFVASEEAIEEASAPDSPRGGTSKSKNVEIASDKHMVEWRQFIRILDKFESRGEKPSALVSGNKGSITGTRITPETRAFIRHKFLTLSKPYASTIRMLIEGENSRRERAGIEKRLSVPDKRSIQRFTKSIRDLEKTGSRRGIKEARLEYALAYGGPVAERPLQRVEMDEKLLDVVTFLTEVGLLDEIHPEALKRLIELGREDPKTKTRLWLSVAFDVASRSVLGMKLLRTEQPTARDAIEVLEMAVGSKAHITEALKTQSEWPQEGVPELVAADHGAAYDSFEFQDCVVTLTGHVLSPPADHPNLRGAIERFFRTIDDRYMHLFPGRTFGNVLERNSDPGKIAALTDVELAEALVRLVIDCYHLTGHSGIADLSPLEAWYHLNNEHVVAPLDEELGRRAFGITIHGRHITNDGLVFLGLPYGDAKLQELRNMVKKNSFSIRVSPRSLKKIWLRTQDGRGYVELECNLSGTENLTLNQWKHVLLHLKKENRKIVDKSWERALVALNQVQNMVADAERKAGITIAPWTEGSIKSLERDTCQGVVFARKTRPDYGQDIQNDLNPGNGRRLEEPEAVEQTTKLDDVVGDRDDGTFRDPDRFKHLAKTSERREARPKNHDVGTPPTAAEPPISPVPTGSRNRLGAVNAWNKKKD